MYLRFLTISVFCLSILPFATGQIFSNIQIPLSINTDGSSPSPDALLHVGGNIRVNDDADLFGLDQVVGYNDLRIYGDPSAGAADIYVGPDGKVSIGGSTALDAILQIEGHTRVKDDHSIFGLDQLIGHNDLRLSGDVTGVPDMTISAAGRVGVNGLGATARLLVQADPSDAIILSAHDDGASEVFAVRNSATAGLNTSYVDVTLNVRPKSSHVLYFNVEDVGGTDLFSIPMIGSAQFTNSLSYACSTIKIDHPLDPQNQYLYHSSVASPEMTNIYNGNITTGADGIAEVTLPNYFMALNEDFRYQLTAIGTFAQIIVKEEVVDNRFVIQSSEPNVKVSWQVTGLRKDQYAKNHPMSAEAQKPNGKKGKYLHPEVFGKSSSLAEGRLE